MDVKEILQSMTILVDTREQVWNHIEEVFIENGYNYRRQKLPAGDYSFEITVDGEVVSFADTIVVERKNSLDELAACFSGDRDRFKREFERMDEANTDCILLVENASVKKLRDHEYRSQLKPNSFEASLLAWKWRYGYDIIFMDKWCTGKYIYNLFYYYVRELYK